MPDELDRQSNSRGHASEFAALVEEHAWAVREQPVEVAYTAYSRKKGQPLLNAVNIVVEASPETEGEGDGGCR